MRASQFHVTQAQAVGVISALIHMGVIGAYMIVAPFGTVDNWACEFERFLPSREVVIYRGNPAERKILQQTSLQHLRGEVATILTEYATMF